MSYHWTNSRVNLSSDEPVYLTLWIARFVLPAPLRAKYGTELLTEQIKNVKGLDPDKLPGEVDQNYRNTTRTFAGTVVDTKIQFSTSFECNVDENGVIYPLNIIKDWSSLIWDPNTAAMAEKRSYIGSLVLENHTKTGQVIRRYDCGIIWPTSPPSNFDFEYQNESIYTLDIDWRAERVNDLVISSDSE